MFIKYSFIAWKKNKENSNSQQSQNDKNWTINNIDRVRLVITLGEQIQSIQSSIFRAEAFQSTTASFNSFWSLPLRKNFFPFQNSLGGGWEKKISLNWLSRWTKEKGKINTLHPISYKWCRINDDDRLGSNLGESTKDWLLVFLESEDNFYGLTVEEFRGRCSDEKVKVVFVNELEQWIES